MLSLRPDKHKGENAKFNAGFYCLESDQFALSLR